MGCAGWKLFWLFCLLSTFLQYGAVRVTVRESTVEVVRGDSATLPCSFFTLMPLFRLSIIWTLTPISDPDSPIQVIVYDHGQVIESPSFIGRVGFVGMPWNADIILNETRTSDAGVYRCVVNNPPETGDHGIGELSLTVLAPPSLPVCLWEGDTDAAGNVRLSCVVVEGFPTPQMIWEKLEPEQITLPVNMDGGVTGSVQIANVSAQTSGLYRCSVSNPLGTQHCYVNLSVYSPADHSPGILQGVMLSLTMALLLLALMVLALWLHRSAQESKWRNSNEDECYNEIKYTPSFIKRSFV
ncbi:immunoglobulin superfamily member 11 [Misgurnus anguillicaudatus]|uniref:immunoglobulin superfamily member 11 n=1 Tax=Misgurnus anguillicaudatus TaxID=75329 RepID=UPI0024359D2A|nr:immunoglobulin superfamily member 11 [Misgurnus anguillicaudatus]